MRIVGLLAALAVSAFIYGCGEAEEEETAQSENKIVPVKAVTVTTRNFEERLAVQGTLTAKFYANVSPRQDGTLERILVDEGDVVEAGKTLLFQVDKENIERVAAAAVQAVAVLKQNLKVADANVEKVRIELKKAGLDKERFVRLHNAGNATANELELYTTQFEQANADLKYALASKAAVEEELKAAEITLDIAKKDLADCTIFAPLSGIVSSRNAEPGEQGSAGEPVIRIEDVKTLEATAHIPGAYYSRVKTGDTKIRVSLGGVQAGEYTVTYKSPVIDPVLRTFEIKAVMPGNPELGAVPGAMADISIVISVSKGLSVPAHSVIARSLGEMIFLVKDGKAVPCGVKTGIANDGWIQIEPAPMGENGEVPTEGDIAVEEGQFQISDNDPVKILGGNPEVSGSTESEE